MDRAVHGTQLQAFNCPSKRTSEYVLYILSPDVGSSSVSTGGSVRICRPTDTRRFSPPEMPL
jgi:hypothetical protein